MENFENQPYFNENIDAKTRAEIRDSLLALRLLRENDTSDLPPENKRRQEIELKEREQEIKSFHEKYPDLTAIIESELKQTAGE